MSQPYLGQITMFGGNFAPRGWALCQGQLLPISQYAALFSILGTSFGGNGTTNFGLPDLRGRVPVHPGTGAGLSTYVMGEMTGQEHITLSSSNMPEHNHLVNAVTGGGSSQTTPQNTLPAAVTVSHPVPEFPTTNVYSSATGNTTMNPTMIGEAGGSTPHTLIQPVLAINFIISLVGIFPSRN